MMKHVCASIALLVLAVAFAAVGFADDKQAGQSRSAPTSQPINKMCAVEHDDPVDPAVTVEYKGKVIGFCCKDCVPKFKEDPEKYMKDLK
jgi:YHS domain-containing protein